MNEETKKRLKKLRLLNMIFFWLSLALLLVSVGLDVASLIISREQHPYLVMGFVEASAILFAGSIALFFVRIFAIGTKIRNIYVQEAMMGNLNPTGMPSQKVDLGTTDVKDIPTSKTKEQELVDQYEDLMKRGYITQEEFEQKKKEILG